MNAPTLPLVITRPQPDADRWVASLRDLGCEAVALPLIEVGPVPEAMRLQPRIEGVADYAAVMWVSGNAVTRFFARRHGPWPVGTRCWAPGPGTAQVLRGVGVNADLIDAPLVESGQYDSEALWQVISSQVRRGVRILLVRGRTEGELNEQGNGRDWLLQRFQAAGAVVDVMAIYERRCPSWSDDTRTQAAQWRESGQPWLFSSSESVKNLPVLMPGADWRRVPALATHERIAQTLQAQGFEHIRICRPTPQDVAASLQSPTPLS